MTGALLRKTLRETWVLLAVISVFIVGFEIIFVWAVSSFAKELTDIWFKFPFLKKLIAALAGADLASDVTITTLMSLGLAHPLLYAATWAFILTLCTRVILAEIDRGTADLLLTLPVSRTRLFSTVTLVWISVGAVLCVMPWIGIRCGRQMFTKAHDIDLAILWLPIANLYALYIAIGCLTLAISTFLTRRGVAIGITLGILMLSFLLNFVVTLVPAAKPWSWTGLLDYYKPLECIRAHELPWPNILALLGFSLVAWLIGLMQFRRRDIPAS
ncbi:MAG: hypothetical protein HZB38_05160 [Planctomycetes bacterium]|nr:hypothetical protein [Planctomycetota bacterium]